MGVNEIGAVDIFTSAGMGVVDIFTSGKIFSLVSRFLAKISGVGKSSYFAELSRLSEASMIS